ncbi:unnamed protein product [Aphanomyces euteiches]
MNALEEKLLSCCDANCVLLDDASTERFLPLFQQAKTESDQAKLLFVLASTAKRADKASSVALFESFGGMKIARQWLDTAISYRQTTLLHFILVTLKELPLQLASITEARINEPIVQLRKTATNEHVKRAAQDLLKHWKTTYTEKSKEQSSSPPSKSKQSSSTGPKTASSNDLLGKLLQKKQDAKASKPKDSTVTMMVQNLKKDVPSPKEVVALPTIARFEQVQSQPSSSGNTRRIKWADEHGAELTKVQLIESWRDLVLHNEKDDAPNNGSGSFNDAKLREHANEKFAFQKYSLPLDSHQTHSRVFSKQKETKTPIVITPTVAWRTPPQISFPEGVTARPVEMDTNESMAQANRTRKDVEWMLLGDEVPPQNPQDWVRLPTELTLGPTAIIPLSDVQEPPQPAAAIDQNVALTKALGPLEKSTISLLLENEHVLAQVYDEAQRNGSRIGDARVLEIINMHKHRNGADPLLSHPPPGFPAAKNPHMGGPPGMNGAAPLLSNPPPRGPAPGYGMPSGYGGGYGGGANNGPPPPSAGYNPPPGYGVPPPYKPPPQGYNAPPPAGYGYGPPPNGAVNGGGYGGSYGYPDDTRKPFNKRPGGPLFQEGGYPPKRPAVGGPNGAPPVNSYKYKQVPCIYFNSPSGCGKGDACTFIHDEDARNGMGGGGAPPSKYAPRGGGGGPPFQKGPRGSHYGGGGRGGYR